MAELHVEKKKSNALWIVLGVLLAALIAWMALRGDDENRNRTQSTQSPTTGALPAVFAPVGAPIYLHT